MAGIGLQREILRVVDAGGHARLDAGYIDTKDDELAAEGCQDRGLLRLSASEADAEFGAEHVDRRQAVEGDNRQRYVHAGNTQQTARGDGPRPGRVLYPRGRHRPRWIVVAEVARQAPVVGRATRVEQRYVARHQRQRAAAERFIGTPATQ